MKSVKRGGLSEAEALARRDQFGRNEIRQAERKSRAKILGAQFASPLVVVLVVACLLSMILGEWPEAAAIGAILTLNALIGYLQEFRAESAVQALAAMTAPRARVLRENELRDLPASEAVPGDLLVLAAGDLVAADGKILEAARLQLNEAVLTGESFPVEKSACGEVFMGTAVLNGTALVEITATGMSTELGRIAHLMTEAHGGETPLQRQLAHVGKTLLVLCLVVVGMVAVLGVLQGRSWSELILFSVSLAVAVVPEGMPAIVTVALAIGVQRMAARNALIRQLPSVETLGSVSVICTDKTGTLTSGEMRVRELWGMDHRALVLAAASCCDETGDTTELAILIEARSRGIDRDTIETQNPRVYYEPFDSLRKRMAIARKDGRIYVKGAVESLLPLCTQTSLAQINAAKTENEELTSRGLRVLAVAIGSGTEEKNLELLGLMGIADPPRTEVMDAIREARGAGVTPIMITGDHPTTAAAIARELGLVMENEPLTDRVHARATPEDKLRLVRGWKAKGAVVAMTGDGVNDAPALKEAHIGIAMGIAGTEVTRQAADLILADDNFATIVAAIREGRGVYQNIRKAILYLLTGNCAELMVVLGASVAGIAAPLLAAHLLWINLVTDALPGLALIADPVSGSVMKESPRSPTEKILGRAQWRQIFWIASLEAVVIGTVFFWQLRHNGIESARNFTFSTMVMSQLFRSVSARSRTKVFLEVGAFSNLWLIAVIGVTMALQLSLHFVPIGQSVFGLQPITAEDFSWMLPVSLIPVSVIELVKIARK